MDIANKDYVVDLRGTSLKEKEKMRGMLNFLAKEPLRINVSKAANWLTLRSGKVFFSMLHNKPSERSLKRGNHRIGWGDVEMEYNLKKFAEEKVSPKLKEAIYNPKGFSVGQRVEIVEPKNEVGGWIPEMKKFVGDILTIEEIGDPNSPVHHDHVTVEENSFNFPFEALRLFREGDKKPSKLCMVGERKTPLTWHRCASGDATTTPPKIIGHEYIGKGRYVDQPAIDHRKYYFYIKS